MSTTSDIKCPNCGVWTSGHARFCCGCGYDLNELGFLSPPNGYQGGYVNKDFTYTIDGDNGHIYHYHYPNNDEKIIKLLEKILEKLEEIRM